MSSDTKTAPAYSSGMRGNEKRGGKGKLRRVSIEIEKNGFVVECHYERKNKSGEPLWEDPLGNVFVSAEDALELIREKLSAKDEDDS